MNRTIRIMILWAILVLLLSPRLFAQSDPLFTIQEQAWISNHQNTINVASECFYPPLIYKDSAEIIRGLSVDYLAEIEKLSGLEFNFLPCENLHHLLEHENNMDYDLISSVKPTISRKQYLNFSDNYIELPVIIVSKKNHFTELNNYELDNYRITVGAGYSAHEYLAKNFPQYHLIPVGNEMDAMNKLLNDEADLWITDIAVYSYMTLNYKARNLKAVGMFTINYSLAFACPKKAKMDTLLTIINKSLAAIPVSVHQTINEKWIHINTNTMWHDMRLYRSVLWGLILLAFLVLWFFIWNLILRKRVAIKTRSLSVELEQRLKTEQELKIQNSKYVKINEKLNELNSTLESAYEKANESDRLKSAFLTNISHEIRTPMNGIMGFSSLLEQGGLSEDNRLLYLNYITINCNRLLLIVDDILEISLLQTGRSKKIESTFNLNEFLNEITQNYRHNYLDSPIDFSLHTSLLNQVSYIVTDQIRLKRILCHLLDNAFKFTEKGKIELGYTQKDDQLVFHVKDTGIGIEAEMQQKIFDHFRKLEIQSSRLYGGIGIGLTIAKKLIELMEGHIWIESQIEDLSLNKAGGTSIYISIPYTKAIPDETPQGLHIVDAIKTKSNTILIVEDEITNFDYMNTVLSNSGLIILHANHGAEAIELCIANPDIALVLMDIKMPVMDGYEATRRIKQMYPKLPIIAQTAFALNEDMGRAYESGCSEYLSKPISRHALKAVIDKYIA
ncbi:MAG: transporter substrate-binding domain-containing protein [Bacteroidales bacterium]|nr:transporter substrate-binding domain-containing protein [Bacteroidales bacterium]